MMPPVAKVLSMSPKTYSEQKPGTIATLIRMFWYRLEILYESSVNLDGFLIDNHATVSLSQQSSKNVNTFYI